MNLYMNIIVLVTTVQQIILKCITLKQKTFLFCIILKDLKYANGLADGSGSEHLKKKPHSTRCYVQIPSHGCSTICQLAFSRENGPLKVNMFKTESQLAYLNLRIDIP